MTRFVRALVAAVALCAAVHAERASAVMFGQSDYFAAAAPAAIVVGDFNRDGRPDTAVADAAGGKVVVFPGTATGSSPDGIRYAVAAGPASLAAGDFNGDGNLDLATASLAANRVSVLYGNGDGSFRRAPDVRVGDGPLSLAGGDLNGDGRADLVAGNVDGGSLSILTSTAGGSFSRRDIAVRGGLRGVAIADLDRDGHADIVVANEYANRVHILFSRPGGYRRGRALRTGRGPLAVAALEPAAGGRPALVTANQLSSSVSFFAPRGARGFATRVDRRVPSHPQALAAADVTGDGRPDVITGGWSARIAIVPGGSGGLGRSQTVLSDGGISAIAAESSASDPHERLVAASRDSGNVTVLDQLDERLGVRFRSRRARVARAPQTVSTGDFNGDRKPDVVAVGDWVSVSLGDGKGGLRSAHRLRFGGFAEDASVGDVNGDGKQDLVLGDEGESAVLLGRGDGTFAKARKVKTGPLAQAAGLADVNGDGKLDIVQATDEALADDPDVGETIAAGRGDGSFAAPQRIAGAPQSQDLDFGDFNRDGNVDIALRGDSELAVLLARGDGTFRVVEVAPLDQTNGAESQLTVADLNRDGALDIAVATREPGTVSVYLGHGDGTFAAGPSYAISGGPFGIATADFNGDGAPDLALSRFDANRVSVLAGNGDGTFAERQEIQASPYPSSLPVADFNRDGRPDLATEDVDHNAAWILTNARGG